MSSTTATSKPFPLLNLPSVAINEFLKHTDFYEQFQLSFVSKKTRNIVKKFVKRLRISFNLSIFFPRSYSMTFCRSNNKGESLTVELQEIKDSYFLKNQLRFDDVDVPVDYSFNNYDHTATTYWKDEREGVKYLLSYFLDVFNINVSLDIMSHDEHLVSEVLSKLQNSRLDLITCRSKDSSDALYQKILDLSCKELNLFTNPSSNFRYRNSMMPMKFSKLLIFQADWAHLDDFLHCKQVVLYNTNLKPNEFNRFLKKWLQSDFQLKYLGLNMEFSHFTWSLDGIPVTPLQQARTGYGRLRDFEDGHCFEIQRSNGEKAVVFHSSRSVTLKTEAYRCF